MQWSGNHFRDNEIIKIRLKTVLRDLHETKILQDRHKWSVAVSSNMLLEFPHRAKDQTQVSCRAFQFIPSSSSHPRASTLQKDKCSISNKKGMRGRLIFRFSATLLITRVLKCREKWNGHFFSSRGNFQSFSELWERSSFCFNMRDSIVRFASISNL